MTELAWGAVPGIIKRRLNGVSVDGDVQDLVWGIQIQKIAVVRLRLIDVLERPKCWIMVAIGLQHLTHELVVTDGDQLGG